MNQQARVSVVKEGITMDLADTEIFRKANIAALIRICKKLDEVIELLTEIAKPVEFTMTEEEFNAIQHDFGTTD